MHPQCIAKPQELFASFASLLLYRGQVSQIYSTYADVLEQQTVLNCQNNQECRRIVRQAEASLEETFRKAEKNISKIEAKLAALENIRRAMSVESISRNHGLSSTKRDASQEKKQETKRVQKVEVMKKPKETKMKKIPNKQIPSRSSSVSS